MEGTKHDQGKPRMELIPPELPEAVAVVLTFGAVKYEDRNWEKGMKWSRVFGALMRHMWAWWKGEKSDPETGYSHLWHAACCITFLIAYEQRKVGEDDRPITPNKLPNLEEINKKLREQLSPQVAPAMSGGFIGKLTNMRTISNG